MVLLVLLIVLTRLWFLADCAGDRGRQRVGFLSKSYWDKLWLMVVDTVRREEEQLPACNREGMNWLMAQTKDRLCSGVSRSLAVSAPDLGVMGGHHRQQ